METIGNVAAVAQKIVLGKNDNKNNGVGDMNTTTTNATSSSAHGGVSSQPATGTAIDPSLEPPSGGEPGKGTIEAPFDPGNAPEQAAASTSTSTAPAVAATGDGDALRREEKELEKTAVEDSVTSPTSASATTPAPTATATTTTATEAGIALKPAKKTATGTAKPGSHSALFGLGPSAATGSGASSPTATKQVGGSGTIEEAADEETGIANGMEKKAAEGRADEDEEAGGYMGLRNAAREEEEKLRAMERRNGGAGNEATAGAGAIPSIRAPDRSADAIAEDEGRDPRSMHKNNSYTRDISPGEMPDGTHRKSIAEMPPPPSSSSSSSHTTAHSGLHPFGRRANTGMGNGGNGGGSSGDGGGPGGLRDKLKDRFRSKK